MPKSFSYHPKREVSGIWLAPEDLVSPMSIASGGFATLWRAGSRGQYAIKCFNNGGMAAATEEFEVLCSLSGRKVVPQVYGLGTFVDGVEQGHAAIVEEYVEGYTLAVALKRGLLARTALKHTLDASTTIAIAFELARALEQLEKAGISHRDLSANNVMLRRDCVQNHFDQGVRLLLIDFGQSTPTARPSVTPSFRARLATVPYGAPEMYGGKYWQLRNSTKCDIWSFGAICVTMLAGEYWPDEISDLVTGLSSPDDLVRIAQAKREPLNLLDLMRRSGKRVGDLERRIANLVWACTQYDPNARPNASSIVRVLQEIMLGGADPTPPLPPPPSPVPPPPPPPLREFQVEGTTLIRYAGSRREVRIPDGITGIGAHAFRGAVFVERVLLPDSVKVVGDYAFEGCASLRGIAISSVERLGIGAFGCCSSLPSIVIREPVDAVPQYLFRECTSLETVYLPNSVQSIGREAFAGCTSLMQMEIPRSVAYVGDRAFYGCASLDRIVVPDSVVEVGASAFNTGGHVRVVGWPRKGNSYGRNRLRVVLLACVLAFLLVGVAMLMLGSVFSQPRDSSSSSSSTSSVDVEPKVVAVVADDDVCSIKAYKELESGDGQRVRFKLTVKNQSDEVINVHASDPKKGEMRGFRMWEVKPGEERIGYLDFPNKGSGHVYKARLEVREEERLEETYEFNSNDLKE